MHHLKGKQFGKLLVIEKTNKRVRKQIVWKCKCECGNIVEVPSWNLVAGITKSCRNCIIKRKPQIEENPTKKIRLYHIWNGMKQRCNNKNSRPYKNYGGRGIKVCDEWANDYTTFAKWARANGYADNLTIERIDNNKGYSPENCKWASYVEQNNNRRSNHIIWFNGEGKTAADWERSLGLKPGTIKARVHRGIGVPRIFSKEDLRRKLI